MHGASWPHAGTTVTYDEVEVVTEMEAVSIPHGVETEYTPDMVPGTVKVLRPGSDGSGIGTFLVTSVNGEIESGHCVCEALMAIEAMKMKKAGSRRLGTKLLV